MYQRVARWSTMYCSLRQLTHNRFSSPPPVSCRIRPFLSLFSYPFPSHPPSPPPPPLYRASLLCALSLLSSFHSLVAVHPRAHQDAFPEFALAKNQVAEFRITSKLRTALSTGMGMGPPGAIDTTGINLGALKEALDTFYARTSGSAKLGQMGKACVAVLNLRIGLRVSVRSANKDVHRVVDRRSSRRRTELILLLLTANSWVISKSI